MFGGCRFSDELRFGTDFVFVLKIMESLNFDRDSLERIAREKRVLGCVGFHIVVSMEGE